MAISQFLTYYGIGSLTTVSPFRCCFPCPLKQHHTVWHSCISATVYQQTSRLHGVHAKLYISTTWANSPVNCTKKAQKEVSVFLHISAVDTDLTTLKMHIPS